MKFLIWKFVHLMKNFIIWFFGLKKIFHFARFSVYVNFPSNKRFSFAKISSDRMFFYEEFSFHENFSSDWKLLELQNLKILFVAIYEPILELCRNPSQSLFSAPAWVYFSRYTNFPIANQTLFSNLNIHGSWSISLILGRNNVQDSTCTLKI